MEPLDPNWFYSTLAQSTAAIVGLVGAFLIQRVLAIRETISQDRWNLRTELETQNGNARRTAMTCAAVREQLAKVRTQLVEAQRRGESTVVLDGPLDGLSPQRAAWNTESVIAFGGSTHAEDLEHRIGDVDAATKALQELERELPAGLKDYARRVRRAGSIAKVPQLSAEERSIIQRAGKSGWSVLLAQPATARRALLNLVQDSEQLAGRSEALDERIGVRSFWTLLSILTFLMLAGVIAPMFWLSDRAELARGVLLVPFALGATALLGYYGYEVYRLQTATHLGRKHL